MSSVPGNARVSWYVDSPAPGCQSADSGSDPRLLLFPPETSGGTEATLLRRSWDKACAWTRPSRSRPPCSSAPNSPGRHGDGNEDDDGVGVEGDGVRDDDASPVRPDAERFLLPRSSPVISRHHRPVSWAGGEPDTSGPSGTSLSLDQQTVNSVEDLRSRPRSSPPHGQKKTHSVSTSSNLNHFLRVLLPPPSSGQQGLAEEPVGWRPGGCTAPPTPGLSTSCKHRKHRGSSGVPEFSDIFRSSCELEKENAHFIVVDMVLDALESVKWTLSLEGHTSTTDAQTLHSDDNVCAHTYRRCAEARHSVTHTHRHADVLSVLSTDTGLEDCGRDATLIPAGSFQSAEWLAQQLVLEFRRSWLPSPERGRGRQSLRSSLQQLSGSSGVAASGGGGGGSLTEEIRRRTRMRGSQSWTPPRFQIIFTIQPALRRSEVVALQHFLCAGCGTQVEPRHIRKLRYCEYLGRYFCDCCHSGAEAVIPARVLSVWDFSRYPVSDFSRQLLESVWFQPLFDLTCVCQMLSGRVKELHKFREQLEQLQGVCRLLKTCRLSGRVMTEFEQLPAHLISEQPRLLSMDDLLRLRRGQLAAQARGALHAAVRHVETCELCLARGFICEFCRSGDVVFPFQRDTCRRCPVCKTCFHRHCFTEKTCPKCARIQSRKPGPDGSVRSDSRSLSTDN